MKTFTSFFFNLFFLLILVTHTFSQKEDTTKVYQGKTVTVTAERDAPIRTINRIAAKIPIPLQLTPISVGVVSQKVLKDQNATLLSNALWNISSINVQNSLGTHDYFLIRGFESTSAGLILTDGAIEPGISLFRFYGFGFHDLYNVEQVEVLKGPAAFLYGANTLSGAINLMRKQPVFRNFTQISVDHSRFESYRETIDWGYANSNSTGAFRLNGVWQATNQFRPHARNQSYALNPALLWKLKDKRTLQINLEYIHNHINPDLGIPLYIPEEKWLLPDVPLTTSYQSPFDELKYDILRLRCDFEKEYHQYFQLRNKTFLTHLNGDSRFSLAHLPNRDVIGNWWVERHIYSFDEQQIYFGNQFEALATLVHGSIKHNLVTGVEIAHIGNHSSERTTLLNRVRLFAPLDVTQQFDELLTFQICAKTNIRQWNVAPYVVDYITFSEKVQLFCGGRVDYIDFYTDRRNAPFDFIGRSLSSSPEPFFRSFFKFSPMVGLVLRDSEKLRFYVNAGKSFAQSHRVIDEPEISTQFEIGYKYKSLNERLRTSAAIYYLQKENMSIPLTGPLQGDLHSPTGIQRSEGIEIEMQIQPIRDCYLLLMHSYTQAELIKFMALTSDRFMKLTLADFSGKKPVFVPAQISDLWLNKDFKCGAAFGIGVRYISGQYVNWENSFTIDSHFIFRLQTAYHYRNWGLRLFLENSDQKQYLTRGLGPYSVIPQESFRLSGKVDITF